MDLVLEVEVCKSREGDRFTTFSGVVEWVVGWVVWMNREYSHLSFQIEVEVEVEAELGNILKKEN